MLTIDRGRQRGPYRPLPDPSPSCPSCGGPLDAGPTADGLAGVCIHPACPEHIVIFRRAESGVLLVAERVRRTPQPARAVAIADVAG